MSKALYLDVLNRYRTQSLFIETFERRTVPPPYTPEFTLGPEDHVDGYRSLRKMYIEDEDVTGYTTAMRALGSWDHWLTLKGLVWFSEHLKMWEEELEAKLRSVGVLGMVALAREKDRAALQWLSTSGWDHRRPGRPSKQEVDAAKKRAALIKGEIDDDAERIGIH